MNVSLSTNTKEMNISPRHHKICSLPRCIRLYLDFSRCIGNKTGTIKCDIRRVLQIVVFGVFHTYSIGSYHRRHIRCGMTLHRSLPMTSRIQLGILWFRSYSLSIPHFYSHILSLTHTHNASLQYQPWDTIKCLLLATPKFEHIQETTIRRKTQHPSETSCYSIYSSNNLIPTNANTNDTKTSRKTTKSCVARRKVKFLIISRTYTIKY
jgi:hypothetical protein